MADLPKPQFKSVPQPTIVNAGTAVKIESRTPGVKVVVRR